MLWYDKSSREIVAAPRRSPYSRIRSTHFCPGCGGQLTTVFLKTDPNNWFAACENCPYKWDPARPNPDIPLPLVAPGGEGEAPPAPDFAAYQQGAIRPEPAAPVVEEVIPEPEPEPEPEDPNRPLCKMCGNLMEDSKYQKGEAKTYYCMTCHSRGFSTSYDPAADLLDFKVKRTRQILYQGPYEAWNPDPNNGVQIGVELAGLRGPIENVQEEDAGELDAGGDVLAEDMITEEYQPDADLAIGDIRLLSSERRALLGLSPEGEDLMLASVSQGVLNGKRGLNDSIERYVEKQYFVAMMEAGEIQDADPLNSPVVLDSMAGDVAADIAENPLYQYTEIGAKGLLPNSSQANAFKIIAETDKNMIICFPTGSGKTACAEAAIASGLLGAEGLDTKPLSIYVCPSRALTSQVARDFSDPEHPFSQNGWGVVIERGQRSGEDPDAAEEETEANQARRRRKGIPRDLVGVPWAENLAENVDDASVMVVVPERLLTCLMASDRYPWVNRITTMIFDEGHLIGEKGRGPKFEGQQIYLYRNYYRKIRATEVGARARIVFMSATMENALELSSWQNHMTGENVDWTVAWGQYQPVPLEISFEPVSVGDEDAEQELAAEILRKIRGEENLGNYLDPRTGRLSRTQMPTIAFVHVLRHGRMIQNIARKEYRQCPRCDFIFPAERLPENPDKFRKAEDTICQRCRSFPVEEWEVDFYHAHVSPAEQERMVRDYNRGKNKTLIASPALAAGVNLSSMVEFQWDMERAGKDVDTSVVRQMIGRTGRQSFAHLYPDQPGKIEMLINSGKYLHHQRRLNAGAYLESHFASPLGATDNILRSVIMGGIRNWQECGEFMASSLSYYQAQVDRSDPLNIRRALEAISKSAAEGGGENDRITWQDQGECLHPNVAIDGEAVAQMNDVWPVVCKECGMKGEIAPTALPRLNWLEEADCQHENYTVSEEPLAISSEMRKIVCNDCGTEGTIDYRMVPKDDGHFARISQDGMKDLVAYGLMVMDPQGNLAVTKLGADVVISHMDCSSAIDVLKNSTAYNVAEATPIQLAFVLGRLRVNDDEDSGRFITEEQASYCDEALDIMGMTPQAATPAVKMVQCIYWSLLGVPYDEIPDCLKKDYLSVADEYSENFTRGFEAISSRARWFEGDRNKLETLKVQLSKHVPPEAAKFAVVDGIKSEEAWALSAAGFVDLFDVMRAPADDIRWGDFYYYRYRMDKKDNPPIKNLPSTIARTLDSPSIKDRERRLYRWQLRYIKDVARVGLDGERSGRWIKKRQERDGRVFFKLEYVNGIVDRAYKSSVWSLNEGAGGEVAE